MQRTFTRRLPCSSLQGQTQSLYVTPRHKHSHSHSHTRACTLSHAHTHTHTHAHTHAQTHVHVHVHTHTRTVPCIVTALCLSSPPLSLSLSLSLSLDPNDPRPHWPAQTLWVDLNRSGLMNVALYNAALRHSHAVHGTDAKVLEVSASLAASFLCPRATSLLHTHTHSLSLSHTHSLSLSLSLTHSLTHSLALMDCFVISVWPDDGASRYSSAAVCVRCACARSPRQRRHQRVSDAGQRATAQQHPH